MKNRKKTIRTFSTLLEDLQELKAWFESKNCHHVPMESIGIYWQTVYNILETAFDSTLSIIVANARHIKNVPGKKTDTKNVEWIATLLRSGILNGNFIPP